MSKNSPVKSVLVHSHQQELNKLRQEKIEYLKQENKKKEHEKKLKTAAINKDNFRSQLQLSQIPQRGTFSLKPESQYDPFDKPAKADFSLKYDPLEDQKKEDARIKQSFENKYPQTAAPQSTQIMRDRRDSIQAQLKQQRQTQEDKLDRMEEGLPSHLKQLPRKLPGLIKKMGQQINNRIMYKERIDDTRQKNLQQVTQKQNNGVVQGLAKLKGINLSELKPKSEGDKSEGGIGLAEYRRPRNDSKVSEAPKPKKLRPEEDPDFIFCFRCQKHHHKNEHKLGIDPTLEKNERIRSDQAQRIQANASHNNNSYSARQSIGQKIGSINSKQEVKKPTFVKPMPMRKPLAKKVKRMNYSDEEDYSDGEEEQDDFIDDSHLDDKQRKHLRKMYRESDEYSDDGDLRGMDAGFDDIEYEEEISDRIARHEDMREEMINRKFGRGMLQFNLGK